MTASSRIARVNDRDVSSVDCESKQVLAAQSLQRARHALCIGSTLAFVTAAACTGWEEVEFHGSRDGLLSVHADASLKSCPDIHYYTVSPLQTSVGSTLSLRVSASSAAGAVVVRWSGTGGTIKDPSAFETTYRCEQAGPQTIELNVRGNSCARTQRVNIRCVRE